MAKKNNEAAEVAQVTTNVVAVIADTEIEIAKAKTDLTNTTIGSHEQLQLLQNQYMGLAISGIADLATYRQVTEGISKLRSIRTGIEKRRKELTAPVLRFQSELKAYADDLAGQVGKIEDHLKSEKTKFDDAKAAAERELYQQRLSKLTGSGYQLANGYLTCGVYNLHVEELIKLTDEQFDQYVGFGEEEKARKEAEERVRKEREETLRLEQERVRKEREALEQERRELARLKAEMDAQKKALEKTYDNVPNFHTNPDNPETFNAPAGPATPVQTQQSQDPAPAATPSQPQSPPATANPHGLTDREMRIYNAGFNACRRAAVKLLKDSPPQKREAFIEQISKMPITYEG